MSNTVLIKGAYDPASGATTEKVFQSTSYGGIITSITFSSGESFASAGGGAVNSGLSAGDNAVNTRGVLWASSFTTGALEPIRSDSNGLAVNSRFYDIIGGDYFTGVGGSPLIFYETAANEFYGPQTLGAVYKYSNLQEGMVRDAVDSLAYNQANVTVGTSSTTLRAAPAAGVRRTGLIISNSSVNTVHVSLVGGAASATNGIHIAAGSNITLTEKMVPQGEITCIASAISSQVCVFETTVTE